MKKIFSSLLIPALALLALSCEKEQGQEQTSGKAVLGVSVEGLPELVELPQNQSIAYNLYVVAEPGPSDALKVTLAADPTFVDEYNATMGTAYEMLPAEAYEVVASDLMLMRYNKQSVPGTLKLKGAGCEIDKTYLLPVVVDKVQGTAQYEAPLDKVAYVFFKMTEAQIEGAGSAASPYIISDAFTFSKMGNMLKDGETVHVKLTADIDLAGEAWTSIDATGKAIFLDGDNHTISNVVAENALFINLEGTVQNLTIDGATINAGVEQGGVLANTAQGATIKNVTVKNASIENVGHAGGLISRITDCQVENVNVQCDVKAVDRVGGMFGHTIGSTLVNCVASGNVTAESYYSGGLIGMMHSTSLKGCGATGNVTHTTNTYSRIGGLVGQLISTGSVENCYATGTVYAGGYFGGGLIGVVESVETVDGATVVHTVTIKQSYSTGSVTLIRDAKDAGAGGLVGRLESGKLVVTDCYSSSAIEADRYSGGFIGDMNKGELVITNGFCNGDLSKLGPDANGNHSDAVAIGCVRTPAECTIKCAGFVAWDTLGRDFCYQNFIPSAGNYHGAEGTISSQASAFGWDTSIWDLSGDVPALK